MWVIILTYFSLIFHTHKYATLSCKSFVVVAFNDSPACLDEMFMDISSYLYLVAKYSGRQWALPTWQAMALSSSDMAKLFMKRLYTITMKARRRNLACIVFGWLFECLERINDEAKDCTFDMIWLSMSGSVSFIFCIVPTSTGENISWIL